MSHASLDGLVHLTDAVCAELCARFATAGFSGDLVAEAEGFVPGVLRAPRLPVIRWWLGRRPEPGALLARLFVFEDELTPDEATAALGDRLLAFLERAGVLQVSPSDGVTSPFLLSPVPGGMWILSDHLTAGRDAAMGPGGGTEYLGRLVPQPFPGAVLDLGCGAGTLALIAAHHGARRAVGVDINPRAIAIARFNARLNGLAAEFLIGDGIEPVAAERFDLVLSQPPFVVKPPDQPELTFLYGGPGGDELPLRFVGEIPRVLSPRGRGLVLMQSAEREGQPLAARLRSALGDAPTTLVVLGTPAPPPAVQASVFASYEDGTFGASYAAAVRRYLDHFEAKGLRLFGGALVVLENRAGAAHAAGAELPAAAAGEHPVTAVATRTPDTFVLKLRNPSTTAEALERFLRGTELASGSGEAIAAARLRLAPHARMVTEASDAAGGAAPRAVIRVDAPGIGTDLAVSREDLANLAAIDAAPSVGAALDGQAQLLGIASDDLREPFVALARRAVVAGILCRVDEV